MKILILSGSPRKDSNTDLLVEALNEAFELGQNI
jgi:NAD(P)H-dependent FMN reductase